MYKLPLSPQFNSHYKSQMEIITAICVGFYYLHVSVTTATSKHLTLNDQVLQINR